MRWRLHLLLTIAIGLCGGRVCHAQDAGKIISQYVKAVGGSKRLSSIKTLSLAGSFDAGAEGKSGTFTMIVKQPNRYYTEWTSAAGGAEKRLIEAYNGKSGWRQGDNAEIHSLLGQEAVEIEAAGEYYNARLQNLSKHKIGAAFKGHSQIGGRDALQVELTYPTGVHWEVYFDPQTHLIAAEAATIAGVRQEFDYAGYQTVNGVKVPSKIQFHRGSEIYAVNVSRASVNEPVAERVFDFPKKSQVQLPDLKQLFEEIDKNQKEIDKIKENYAGTRVEEETEYDKSGKVTKNEAREYTFFYLDGDEVSTLVKKDSKRLSADEQRKENEKTQKEIERLQKREEKKEAKQEKAKQQGKESKDKDKDDPDIEVFLRACQFVNPRRERFRGQDVLVFDFEPNPEYKPKNLAERVVKQLAGVVWVDEKARDVARLEAYFINDVKIAGGVLAKLQKGTSFVFEQAYVNNEVWLPTYEEMHIGARVLLVKGFKMNMVTRYSDYQRFHVETLSKIRRPAQTATPPPEN